MEEEVGAKKKCFFMETKTNFLIKKEPRSSHETKRKLRKMVLISKELTSWTQTKENFNL